MTVDKKAVKTVVLMAETKVVSKVSCNEAQEVRLHRLQQENNIIVIRIDSNTKKETKRSTRSSCSNGNSGRSITMHLFLAIHMCSKDRG